MPFICFNDSIFKVYKSEKLKHKIQNKATLPICAGTPKQPHLFASLNMAATGEDSLAAEIQVIKNNPESSPGKSMISERNSTAEVISQAIQSQLVAMLPNTIHETLAKKNLTDTASSSQTLNTSSNSLSRLAARSMQGSNDSLSVRSAAGSTKGLNSGHVEISDPLSKKTKFSSAKEDFSDDITIPAGHWDASEELPSFLDVVFADKLLSVYDRKQIMKEFPRPNVESVFTSVLDDCLGSLVTGAKRVDKEAKKLQDQLLDIVGPLSMAFEHISLWQENEDDSGTITLPTQDVKGLYACLSKALTLLGSVNAQYKVQRRKQVLDKVNPQMSSLASEPFPDGEKNLFCPSFVEKVKKWNETVKILSKAAPRKSNTQFFRRGTSSQFRQGRGGQFPGRWSTHQSGFPARGRSSYFRGRGRSRGKSPDAQPNQNYVAPQSFQ